MSEGISELLRFIPKLTIISDTLASFVPRNNAELRVTNTIPEHEDLLRPGVVRLVELLDRPHKGWLECVNQLLPTRLQQPVIVMRTKNVAK